MDVRLFLLAACLVIAVSAEVKTYDLDSGSSSPCSQAYAFKFEDTVTVTTNGSIKGDKIREHEKDHNVKFCRLALITTDKPPNCDVRHMCVSPAGPLSRQCFAGVVLTWRDNGGLDVVRTVNLANCREVLKMESTYCANGDELEIEVYESILKSYKMYSFKATITNKCEKDKYVEPTKETKHDEDVHFKDLEEEIHKNRVLGIITGVCLCSIFLVILLVTYFYYKNKAYTGVPSKE